MMDIQIVIPAHNEEAFLAQTLQSLVNQTLKPHKIIVVNDSSTDRTQHIIEQFSGNFGFIKGVYNSSIGDHSPGSKIINAFNKGFERIDDNFDIICKFDADLVFPENYLAALAKIFTDNPNVGMAGGFCYIEKSGKWILENLTNKDHLRGAIKAYRKSCFEQIGGLKNTMGWDTVDELLAQYHGWQVITDSSLKVKHLKPTGKIYAEIAGKNQGKAFYKMRYGLNLTLIASLKLASKKRNLSYFKDCLKGYMEAKKSGSEFIVSEKEGRFIRKLRWKGVLAKLGM